MAAALGLNPSTSSVTPFLTPSTKGYNYQSAGIFCLSPAAIVSLGRHGTKMWIKPPSCFLHRGSNWRTASQLHHEPKSCPSPWSHEGQNYSTELWSWPSCHSYAKSLNCCAPPAQISQAMLVGFFVFVFLCFWVFLSLHPILNLVQYLLQQQWKRKCFQNPKGSNQQLCC